MPVQPEGLVQAPGGSLLSRDQQVLSAGGQLDVLAGGRGAVWLGAKLAGWRGGGRGRPVLHHGDEEARLARSILAL